MTDSTLDVRWPQSWPGVSGRAPEEPDAADGAAAATGTEVPSAAAVPGAVESAAPLAAPPAATTPASDHATIFIEIRFASGRFGIFLFLGVAERLRGSAANGRLASNAAMTACSPASSPWRAGAAAALSTWVR